MTSSLLHRLSPALAVTALSATALAADASFTPPPQKGEIYFVVKYRDPFGLPTKTKVNIAWGSWNHSGSVSPPMTTQNALNAKGFVVKLQHRKDDSVPLKVNTDGAFVVTPFQGAPPSQWSEQGYKRVSW